MPNTKLRVTVATQGVDELKSINWSDSSDRKWLTNHMHWAMNQGKSVLLHPAHITQGESWEVVFNKAFN